MCPFSNEFSSNCRCHRRHRHGCTTNKCLNCKTKTEWFNHSETTRMNDEQQSTKKNERRNEMKRSEGKTASETSSRREANTIYHASPIFHHHRTEKILISGTRTVSNVENIIVTVKHYNIFSCKSKVHKNSIEHRQSELRHNQQQQLKWPKGKGGSTEKALKGTPSYQTTNGTDERTKTILSFIRTHTLSLWCSVQVCEEHNPYNLKAFFFPIFLFFRLSFFVSNSTLTCLLGRWPFVWHLLWGQRMEIR